MNNSDNAFLGSGIDALFGAAEANPNEYEIMVNLDDVEIEAQVREEFEDEGNDLASFGKSLRKRQLQAIVIRPNREGRDKPFLLVAGERRMRAARLEGLPQLRARVVEMTDEEAEDAQLAENIHRKNLTQIEEAKKIQRDLDRLGDVGAVLEKHHKSRAWLSKMLALLSLPEQAKRLVTENVSADIEVINTVKTIEKVDPAAAKELVDDLKATRGKENARDKTQAVKEKVKPSKKPKAEKPAADKPNNAGSGQVATPKDRSQEEPGEVAVFAPAKTANDTDKAAQRKAEKNQLAVEGILEKAFSNIVEFGAAPAMIADTMKDGEKELADEWLLSFYDAGQQTKDVGRAVMLGFRNGQFSTEGAGAFALAAFLYGADSDAKFNIVNVLGSVKP